MTKITCSNCGRPSNELLDIVCTFCGQPLEVNIDGEFEQTAIKAKDFTIWRYRHFFDYVDEKNVVSLGEGWTPLVEFSDNLYFKLDGSNPTGSFKDRGSSVLISAVHERIKSLGGYISEDSSGNAGASMAAYATRAETKIKIYVPETVSGPKFSQIQRYGAEVVKVPGSRSKVAEEARKSEANKYYLGHILHPLFRDGIRSLAYEIAEQLEWIAPDSVYLPVSAGTLLLGVICGFEHLVDSNVIEKMPKIVACQTSQVSPLYHRMKNLRYDPPAKVTSIADALVSVNPPLLDLMTSKLGEIKGDALIVEEEEIAEAFKYLARRGFFVEPSSAVAYAGYLKHLINKEASQGDMSVVVLTGLGLKTTYEP